MEGTDDLTEPQIRSAVRDAIVDSGRSLLSTVVWTILGIFSILVGIQLIQFVSVTSGVVAVGFVGIGILVTGSSLYLLYLLHWQQSSGE